ncbi:MAG: EamA family transporter, partial [Ignavibacteria bacterium]|nr:EamA family transporter [Ignavibacteria bacterium]
WGQQRVSSGVAALLIAPEPIWIAAIEWMMIRNFRMGARGMLGLLFGLAGIVVLIDPMEAFGSGSVDLIGSMVILLAAISWSSGAVYLRVARLPKSPAITAGAELLIGGTFLILTSVVTGESLRGNITLTSLLSLAYLIVFGSIIAFSSYVWLLKTTSATRVATHTYVNPIIAVALGWAFAGEEITVTIALTSILIIASVYFVLKDQMTRPGEHAVRRFDEQGNGSD